MDYKKVLRLHFVNHLSSREIAESCGDCGKTSVNEFLKRFREVAQDFSFTFDKVHYSMPRKYLRQELEIQAGEKEIYVYNKHGDLIRTHKRSYHRRPG